MAEKYLIEDLFREHSETLGLELVAGKEGLGRSVTVPETQRPGLSLAGYLKNHASKRILIFGKVEVQYLKDLKTTARIRRLKPLLTPSTPAVIVSRGYKPLTEMIELCDKRKIPLFRSSKATMNLLNKLTILLADRFSPRITCHGTLVEAFGVGLLIQGDSAVGKSEAALGLIEKGHRLVADDVVQVRKCEGTYLEGSGAELLRYHMEVRGIGIINVSHLYGAVCVREKKSIDLVVRLEIWDDQTFYDRVGTEEKYCEILGAKLPYHILPVKPGRDVVLLLETICLNHRLKEIGYNSAKEFSSRLLETIDRKQKDG